MIITLKVFTLSLEWDIKDIQGYLCVFFFLILSHIYLCLIKIQVYFNQIIDIYVKIKSHKPKENVEVLMLNIQLLQEYNTLNMSPIATSIMEENAQMAAGCYYCATLLKLR